MITPLMALMEDQVTQIAHFYQGGLVKEKIKSHFKFQT